MNNIRMDKRSTALSINLGMMIHFCKTSNYKLNLVQTDVIFLHFGIKYCQNWSVDLGIYAIAVTPFRDSLLQSAYLPQVSNQPRVDLRLYPRNPLLSLTAVKPQQKYRFLDGNTVSQRLLLVPTYQVIYLLETIELYFPSFGQILKRNR